MFDFSRFTDRTTRANRGTFSYANFSEDEIQDAISNPGGLFLALKALNAKLVTKGPGPNSAAKGLIVFQEQGFKTTFQDMGAAIGVKAQSAYSYSNVFRTWLRDAFRLECVVEGDNIRMADPVSAKQKAARLSAAMDKVAGQFDNLDRLVTSLQVTNQAVLLPPSVKMHLEAHRSVKQLEASTDA